MLHPGSRYWRTSPLEIFRAAADGEKIHTYLQSLQQQQSLSDEQLPTDKSEIIKEYDRLVDGPAARKRLEKERPSLVAAARQGHRPAPSGKTPERSC